MIIDRTPIRADDPFVAFCGRCGEPMRVCQGLCARRAVVAQAQREPPVADAHGRIATHEFGETAGPSLFWSLRHVGPLDVEEDW